MDKKKTIIIICICLTVLLLATGAFFLFKSINNSINDKINAENIVLVDYLETDFLANVKVSDFIKSIEGTIEDDYKIDTTKIGEREVSFKYITKDNKKLKYSFNISVVDKEPPLIWLSGSYSVTKGTVDDLTKKIMCGDNYDPNPKCEIEGDYDLNKVGTYSLLFKATDSSGNTSDKKFTLKVTEPKSNNGGGTGTKVTTAFNDVIKKYKSDKTEIGIDISKWQGDVNFNKLKAAGVEFVMIRVGTAKGLGKETVIDPKFEQNIKGANEAGIPVGVYYYSYADTRKRAIEDAKWVLNQIKDYKVDLPIVFDWENWSRFNYYNVSFYSLTDVANAFMDTAKENGYEGMLYSSKTYLENIWYPVDYPIWLAHYTKNMNESSYKGDYSYWQLCSNGRVDGINGDVDINVRYLK